MNIPYIQVAYLEAFNSVYLAGMVSHKDAGSIGCTIFDRGPCACIYAYYVSN